MTDDELAAIWISMDGKIDRMNERSKENRRRIKELEKANRANLGILRAEKT